MKQYYNKVTAYLEEKVDVIYVKLKDGKFSHNVDVEAILDIDIEGDVIGIELLHASFGKKPNDSYTRINNEINDHINEIGIYGTEIYRVVGFYKDSDDYYYRATDVQGKVHLLSCVGAFIWLKNSLDEKEYDSLDNVFKLNENVYDETKKYTQF